MCSAKSFRTIHNNIETGGMIMKVAQQQPNIEREVLILIEFGSGKLLDHIKKHSWKMKYIEQKKPMTYTD